MGLGAGIYSSRKNRGIWLTTLNFMDFLERKPGQFQHLVQAALDHYQSLCPKAKVWATKADPYCEIKTTSRKLRSLAEHCPFRFCNHCNETGVEFHEGELSYICHECNGSKISPSSPMGKALQEIGLFVM